MDIKEAKNILNHYLEMEKFDSAGDFLIAIDVVLSELEKKDTEIIEAKEANRQLSLELEKKEAIINEMAKTINKEYYKDIIENYTKKVEKEGIKE